MTRREAVTLLLAAALPLPACADAIPGIVFDLDACEHCRMTISDRRFAAAAITATGRTVRFDSLECLASWVNGAAAPPRALWVSDAAAPGVLIPLATARLHRAAAGITPMGMGFVAVAASWGTTPWDGPVVAWDSVRALVARDGLTPRDPHGGH